MQPSIKPTMQGFRFCKNQLKPLHYTSSHFQYSTNNKTNVTSNVLPLACHDVVKRSADEGGRLAFNYFLFLVSYFLFYHFLPLILNLYRL